ncbi:MAG: hypothetical protein ACYCUI_12470 [Vulcanimicrobiaceae bacterium]
MIAECVTARVLRELGFVPVVPEVSRHSGTAESKAGRHVPVVPVVPAQKSMGENEPTPDLTFQRHRLIAAAVAQGIDAEIILNGTDALRARLHGIAEAHGIPPAIVQAVATAEALSFCTGMTDAELTRWANIVCTRELYRRGLLKRGWAIPSAAHAQGAQS